MKNIEKAKRIIVSKKGFLWKNVCYESFDTLSELEDFIVCKGILEPAEKRYLH